MKEQRQRGFTLVELVVVIAILGVLAAIAVPLITNYLSGAKERAFDADRARLQAAVDGFYNDPSNVRFLGKRQYPLLGRTQTSTSLLNKTGSVTYNDNQDPFTPYVGGVAESAATWSPLGAAVGADISSSWSDAGSDADVREVTTATSSDTWTSVTAVRGATTYHVDPRYYFIDFEKLVTDGWLDEVPESASVDNKPSGGTATYTGRYGWYVDDDGEVHALYHYLPSSKDYQDNVFP